MTTRDLRPGIRSDIKKEHNSGHNITISIIGEVTYNSHITVNRIPDYLPLLRINQGQRIEKVGVRNIRELKQSCRE